MKKRSIIVVAALLLVSVGLIVLNYPFKMSIYIFNDIDECKNLDDYFDRHVTIINHDSPKDDKNLGNLKYTSFFAADCLSSNIEFTIYAYEFESSDAAKMYFKNGTGINIEREKGYNASSGITTFKLFVFAQERAYTVYCKNGDSKELIKCLQNAFSEKVN